MTSEYGLRSTTPVRWSSSSPLPANPRTSRLSNGRLQHWRSIIISACEQSGRNSVPEIAPAQPLMNLLEDVKADHAFVLSPHVNESGDDMNIKPGESVLLLIGPEGGLSDAEVNSAISHGYKPLRLGSRILRTETATIVGLTKLQCQFGDI